MHGDPWNVVPSRKASPKVSTSAGADHICGGGPGTFIRTICIQGTMLRAANDFPLSRRPQVSVFGRCLVS